MKKDTKFYDAQSRSYSASRYPARERTFTHYFFKKRLSIVLGEMERRVRGLNTSILEIGCADGVVLRAVRARFGDAISSAVGVDTSPGMILEASQKNTDERIRFALRNPGKRLPGPVDVVLEVGVLNYLDIEEELSQVPSALASGGIYLCSLSGRSSLLNRVRPYGSTFQHLYSYNEYERMLSRQFHIRHTVPVGLFVPLLWKLPFAKGLQDLIESAFLRLVPDLYLEKVYVLELR